MRELEGGSGGDKTVVMAVMCEIVVVMAVQVAMVLMIIVVVSGDSEER